MRKHSIKYRTHSRRSGKFKGSFIIRVNSNIIIFSVSKRKKYIFFTINPNSFRQKEGAYYAIMRYNNITFYIIIIIYNTYIFAPLAISNTFYYTIFELI